MSLAVRRSKRILVEAGGLTFATDEESIDYVRAIIEFMNSVRYGAGNMYPYSAKLRVSNSRPTPHVVYVEPWANDYTLLPGEELVIVAFGDQFLPLFHVMECEGATQVCCDKTADFKVFQGYRELQCGHNRQPEPNA